MLSKRDYRVTLYSSLASQHTHYRRIVVILCGETRQSRSLVARMIDKAIRSTLHISHDGLEEDTPQASYSR